MKASLLSLIFLIGCICYLIVIKDPSVVSLFAIATVIYISYYMFHKKELIVKEDEVGNILIEKDESVLELIAMLGEYSEIDKELYEKQISEIKDFFRIYGKMLMENRFDKPRFDDLLMLRKTLVDDSYTWILKGSEIPDDIDKKISLPLIAITKKYTDVLVKKFNIDKRNMEGLWEGF